MEERRNEILRELDRKGKVKVTDLSREFGCSEVTIRNDIKAMDIEGLLKRTHGGAVKLETAETETEDIRQNPSTGMSHRKSRLRKWLMIFWKTGIRSSSMMRRPVLPCQGDPEPSGKKGSRL